ncbi:lytic transglycosylase domain-containing protein [Chelatococcus sp. SYSU_G07232]|uniref:Lytic transglycosylase domain-containing protein n=1 Tax=Chelatococcus albus TaxID=3047466 RepID=A0ABT7AJ49_9HYPH|nr:lytic transglycosylase domain-containing protein [Chelatococcus sp. SYSU_G07232]MDJ1158621.1 lytic transglycosylase domain-containing protein [Chelatococcus sp. SYSU_G07232]
MKNHRTLGVIGLAALIAATPVLAKSPASRLAKVEAAAAAPQQTETPRQPGLFESLFSGAKPAESAPAEAGASAGGKRAKAGYVKPGSALGYDVPAREQYRDLMARHAAANGVPFALVDAVVRIESRYNPRAHNAGAIGLMQIKYRTARGVGYTGSPAGLYSPEANIEYGVKYLAGAYRLAGGDTCGTVMRYQGGHYATRMSRANLAYCAKVRTIAASLATGQES